MGEWEQCGELGRIMRRQGAVKLIIEKKRYSSGVKRVSKTLRGASVRVVVVRVEVSC